MVNARLEKKTPKVKSDSVLVDCCNVENFGALVHRGMGCVRVIVFGRLEKKTPKTMTLTQPIPLWTRAPKFSTLQQSTRTESVGSFI
jgi:hypothetical protein